MKILLFISLFFLAFPVNASIWPFTNQCDDVEQQIKEGKVPSKEDAQYYITNCSGDKLESIGDAAAETADKAVDKVLEIWSDIKE